MLRNNCLFADVGFRALSHELARTFKNTVCFKNPLRKNRKSERSRKKESEIAGAPGASRRLFGNLKAARSAVWYSERAQDDERTASQPSFDLLQDCLKKWIRSVPPNVCSLGDSVLANLGSKAISNIAKCTSPPCQAKMLKPKQHQKHGNTFSLRCTLPDAKRALGGSTISTPKHVLKYPQKHLKICRGPRRERQHPGNTKHELHMVPECSRSPNSAVPDLAGSCYKRNLEHVEPSATQPVTEAKSSAWKTAVQDWSILTCHGASVHMYENAHTCCFGFGYSSWYTAPPCGQALCTKKGFFAREASRMRS